MKSFKTAAIVLKRMDLGEADRLLTLFTQERGKIRAINRGARKPLSKLAGHLEPFVLSNCQFQEGKSFYTVTAAEMVDPYAGVRTHLGKTSVAYYLLEMVDALVSDEEAHPSLFELVVETLAQLEVTETPELLLAAFRLKLLTELGYRPELHHCLHCQRELQPEGNFFSVLQGGIIGPECRAEDGAAMTIDPTTIKAMRLILDRSIEVTQRLSCNATVLQQLEQMSEGYLHVYTGRGLQSVGFLRDATA